MAARAMWKGVLVLGQERVPVKLYAALQSRRPNFHLLDRTGLDRVQQEMVDPSSGSPVAADAIQKGYEVADGVFVPLTADDLAAVEPRASRDVALLRFVPRHAVDDRWFDRGYWLGPDGDPEGVAALVAALGMSGRIGVARWVMRKQAQVGALLVRDGHLVLIRLRYAEEVVPAGELPRPKGRDADPREIKLARQLVEALEGPFDPADFPETFADRVRELVAAKAEGKVVAMPERKPARPHDDLAESLEESLKVVRRA